MNLHDHDLDEGPQEAAAASDAEVATVPIVDNRGTERFELTLRGATAFLQYERTPKTFTIIHTEVPSQLRGLHLGERLVPTALDVGRSEGLRLVVVCPFARAYLRKHPPLSLTTKPEQKNT